MDFGQKLAISQMLYEKWRIHYFHMGYTLPVLYPNYSIFPVVHPYYTLISRYNPYESSDESDRSFIDEIFAINACDQKLLLLLLNLKPYLEAAEEGLGCSSSSLWQGVVYGIGFSSSSGEVEWVFFLQPERSEADFDNRFIKFLRNIMQLSRA